MFGPAQFRLLCDNVRSVEHGFILVGLSEADRSLYYVYISSSLLWRCLSWLSRVSGMTRVMITLRGVGPVLRALS